MFSRRLVEPGDLPLTWSQEVSRDAARLQILSSLDHTWDTFKRLNKLDLKMIHPVAVVMNLLPEHWEASIVKAVDHENGVICIQHRKQGVDLSGDLHLGVTKLFAIFHLEDVYTETGERMKNNTGNLESVQNMLHTPVDLSMRCLVPDGGQTLASMYHTAASQSVLAQTVKVNTHL